MQYIQYFKDVLQEFWIFLGGNLTEKKIVGNQTTNRVTNWQDYAFDITYCLFFSLNLYNLIISTIIVAGAKNKYALANASSSLIVRATIIPPKIL